MQQRSNQWLVSIVIAVAQRAQPKFSYESKRVLSCSGAARDGGSRGTYVNRPAGAGNRPCRAN